MGGALTITRQPQNLTVEQHHLATFSIQVNNPSGLPVLYKWYRNGTEIAGANGQSYSFEALSGDNNATFKVDAAKIGSSVSSGTASLTVVPDNTPPQPTNVVSGYTNLTSITVLYDEFVTDATAGDLFSYGSSDLSLSGVTLAADRKSAVFTLAAPVVVGQTYHIEVSNVADLSGNVMPDPITLTFVAGTDLPRLQIDYIDSNYADVSWPAASTGFNLEQTSSLNGGTWTSAGTATVINGRNVVSIYFTPGNKFYRLRQ